MFMFKSSPDGLMMSASTGGSYDAKFNGKDYPLKGGPAGNTVSLTTENYQSIDDIIKSNGKITVVFHMTVSADGKTLTEKIENKVDGTTTTITAIKQ